MFDLQKTSHRRYNPLSREWVLVSPRRLERPWLGGVEVPSSDVLRAYNPDCYLCPGNVRATDARNPNYDETYVFENDIPTLQAISTDGKIDEEGLIVAYPKYGICCVLCFSPRHDLSLPQMSVDAIRRIVDR